MMICNYNENALLESSGVALLFIIYVYIYVCQDFV